MRSNCRLRREVHDVVVGAVTISGYRLSVPGWASGSSICCDWHESVPVAVAIPDGVGKTANVIWLRVRPMGRLVIIVAAL